MGRDRLHLEWAEHERQDERRGRVAVVDDDPEAPARDRRGVERRQQIARVALPDANRVADRADPVGRCPAQLVAREVLLDLLLEPWRELGAGMLEEADLDQLRVGWAHAHVEARGVPLRANEMAVDGRRQDAQVGDADARRRDARHHRSLDHPAGGGRVAAGHDTGAPLKGCAEGRGQADGRLRREIDVDDAGHALSTEEMRRGGGLPDEALVDDRARLHRLVREDPHVGHHDRLRADRDAVAEGRSVVDVDVRANVARLPEDRPLDARAPPDERRLVDHRPHDARPLAEADVRTEHRVARRSSPRAIRRSCCR